MRQGTGLRGGSGRTRLYVGLGALCCLAFTATVSVRFQYITGVSEAFVTPVQAGNKHKKHSESEHSQESSKESESSEHRESGESSLFRESDDNHDDHDDHHEDSGGYQESDNREYSSSEHEHDDDGGDHEDRNDESRNGKRSDLEHQGHHRRHKDDDDRPPRTVLEMLKRLTSPRRSKSGSLGHHTGINSSPRGRNEILAVNLSPRGAKRARSLGFKIRGSMHNGTLNGRVTRLVPPRGMNAGRARNLLQGRRSQGQTGEQFAVNQRYKLYHPARKDQTELDRRSVPSRRAPPRCSGDRCFARQLIRWHSGVESCANNLKIGVIDNHLYSQHPAFSRANKQLGVFLP
ncbi:MAG: hypothetical protein P8Y36_05165 [Alphaproteobacteria bacterium]